MKFRTADVLGVTTGHLLGEPDGKYAVIAFLIGRSAFAEDAARYGEEAASAIKAAIPSIPMPEDASHVTPVNYRDCVAQWEAQFGKEVELPDEMAGAVGA